MLKLGIRWHIGDGRQVRIVEDPWLPVSQPFRCFLTHDVVDKDERVSLLIVELFVEYFLCIFFSLGGILYRCTMGLNKETINHS